MTYSPNEDFKSEPFELKERHFCATSFKAKKILESHGYTVAFEGPRARMPEMSVWFFEIDDDMVQILQDEYFHRPVIWTWPGRFKTRTK